MYRHWYFSHWPGASACVRLKVNCPEAKEMRVINEVGGIGFIISWDLDYIKIVDMRYA